MVPILGADGDDFTINSYEFILRAKGGTVEWGEFTNLQPTMTVSFKERKNDTDYYNGYVGMEVLPPGKYKLGILKLAVRSGNPSIAFAARTPLYPAARTSFGSRIQGKDGDNTLKYTDDPSQLGTADADVPGDWCDARGLSVEAAIQQAGVEPVLRDQGEPQEFSVKILYGSVGLSGARIQVQTTRQGFLRIRMFDVSGRLISELMNSRNLAAGSYTVDTWSRAAWSLPSGVYFYSVESSEASDQGKLVLVR